MSKRAKGQLELFEEGESAGQGPYELPAGWCQVNVADVLVTPPSNGRSVPTAQEGFPVLRLTALKQGRIDTSESKIGAWSREDAAPFLVQKGDFFVARGNGSIRLVGTGGLLEEEPAPVAFPDTLIRLRLSQELVNPRFFTYQWNASLVREQIERRAKTTAGIYKVSQPDITGCQILLPPRNQQDRMVEALDSHFSRLDAAEAGLRRVQANLKRYRAAVLQAAVEGRLVPTEAELARREGRDYEPASALLDRILAERRRRWEEAELARLTARGKPPQNDAWKAKYEEPAAPDAASLPPLPEGWCWATIDQLARDERNSLTDGPFGSNLKTEHYTDTGPRVVRLQNIGDSFFVDEHAHISEEHYNRLVKHAVFPGDIVIASLGTELPRACEVPDWLGRAIVKADCIRFSPDSGLASKAYLTYALNAHPTRRRTMSLVHGIGRPRIGLTLLREIPIPLPPVIEQRRMVSEIERLISIANEMQLAIDADIARCQRLRQAILKQAFEGKLVAQDPKDEPASVLLARIRGEREATAPSTTKTTSGRAGSAGSARPARKRARS